MQEPWHRDRPHLRDQLGVIHRRAFLIALIALVGAGLGLAAISRPTPPRPVVLGGVLGLVGGLLAGIWIALVLQRGDEGVASPRVAREECGGRPCVGLVPEVRAWKRPGAHLAPAGSPASGLAEAYRILGVSLQLMSTERANRVIAVTGVVGGEGATTAVANLAVCLARSGRRVVAVCGDLRRPRLHDFFAVGNDRGLTSLFTAEAALADILVPVAGEPRLRVIPPGPPTSKLAEVLSFEGLRWLCGVLRSNADMVLIDCPPVLPSADALLFSPSVDGILLVASAGATSRRDLRRACETLDLVHAPVLGTVLNQVPTRDRRADAHAFHSSPGRRQAHGGPAVKTETETGDRPAVECRPGPETVDVRSSDRPAPVPNATTTARPGPRPLVDYSHEFRPAKTAAR